MTTCTDQQDRMPTLVCQCERPFHFCPGLLHMSICRPLDDAVKNSYAIESIPFGLKVHSDIDVRLQNIVAKCKI